MLIRQNINFIEIIKYKNHAKSIKALESLPEY